MATSDIDSHQPTCWLQKNPTIHHTDISPSSSGLSLQDVRTYYLRNIQAPRPADCNRETSVTSAPWYIAQPQPSPTSSLCGICKHIDFQWLLRNPTSTNNGPILFLQDMLANRSSCNFCRLATNALCIADGTARRLADLDEGKGNEVMCCCITTHRASRTSNGPATFSIWRRVLGSTQGIVSSVVELQEVGGAEAGCLGRRVSPSADLRLIQSWLTACEKSHEDTSIQKSLLHPKLTGSTLQLRLLDVQNDCIVRRDHATRYVALSYVWGRVTQLRLLMSNFDSLTTKGALSYSGLGAQLPRTISDAKKLVANLGERYLWIDALCLIQDGPDFAAEVQSMDMIYGNAAWTLVSGSAKDANTPLPRLGTELEPGLVPQYEETVAGKSLAAVLPCLEIVLEESTWNQRAWTYQESVLSRRLLIVTKPQMFFTCRHGYTFSEDTRLEDIPPPRNYSDGQFFTGAEGSITNFERYTNTVREYTSRQISFHEDALNAISGVLSSFRSWFRCGFVHGLPLTELDQALLWLPTGNVLRRLDQSGEPLFSSWSWVGWVGICQYPSGLALSRIQWKVEGPDKSVYLTSDVLRRPAHGSVDWCTRQWTEKFMDDAIAMDLQTFDSCWYEDENPDLLFLHPVAPEPQRDSYTLLGSGDGYLQFRALTCELYVTGTHNTEFGVRVGMPCSDDQHSICALNIYDANHRVCGTVHVPGSLFSSLHPGKHEFIRLSRTHLVSDSTRYHTYPPDWDEFESSSDQTLEELLGLDLDDDDEYEVFNDTNAEDNVTFDGQAYIKDIPWCVYNVMLVETKDGISQRVGLGKVHINAFLQDKGTVWRYVELK